MTPPASNSKWQIKLRYGDQDFTLNKIYKSYAAAHAAMLDSIPAKYDLHKVQAITLERIQDVSQATSKKEAQ